MLTWDDFRILLAIARAQRLAGAAEQLGVTLSTVFRRLERMEGVLGNRLFDRKRAGYVPTEIGTVHIRAAERMEQEAASANRQLTGQDQELVGLLRVSASEVLAPFFLARHVPVFRKQYPGLRIEITVTNRSPSVIDGEVDVALWPHCPKDGRLIGRKLGDIKWAVYGNGRSVECENGDIELKDLPQDNLIGLAGGLSVTRVTAAQTALLPEFEVSSASNSLIVNAGLAAAGEGMALLPCLLGTHWPGLMRISKPLTHDIGELWIACHKELYRNARIRVLFDFLISAAKDSRADFEGTV